MSLRRAIVSMRRQTRTDGGWEQIKDVSLLEGQCLEVGLCVQHILCRDPINLQRSPKLTLGVPVF